MPIIPLVYYGKPGLEANVFRAYMTSAGFTVQLVTNLQDQIPANLSSNSFITVISLEESSQELIRVANEIRERSNGNVKRVLILADGPPFEVEAPAVEVIFKPYRLSEIADRIRAISRAE